MKLNTRPFLPLLAGVVLSGCSILQKRNSEPVSQPVSNGPSYEEASRFKSDVNLAKLNELWSQEGQEPVSKAEDAFRVEVDLGDRPFVADTHLFGPLRVIPYADGNEVVDAAERPVGRGDAVLSTYFPPGDIGISVEHHRPSHRVLSFNEEEGSYGLKEHFKLQDSHVGIIVGVRRDGAPGVISLNNPQEFENGGLGEAMQPRIYLRPVYPWYLSKERQDQFRDNIRTMALGFNAVSNFPEDYNGGDPLAARNPDEVRAHVRQMIKAIGGDKAAREWFREPAHSLYCSEFAHLSFSAGLIVPLNEETVTGLVGAKWWRKFEAQVRAHNDGRPNAFTELNLNPNDHLVPLSLAPSGLQPAASYAPIGNKESSRLAFQPMTMADIIEHFMALHFPRASLGEGLAATQAAVFHQLRPGLLEIMAMNELPKSDPQRQAVENLFDRLAAIVAQEYPNYASFRAALQPVMDEARIMSGPRGDSGTGLFVPPHLMHLVALGRHKGGLLGLDYVGHGLHWSILDRVETVPFLERAFATTGAP
jgi:hypothetical protein